MSADLPLAFAAIVDSIVDEINASVVTAAPKLVISLIFLTFAYAAIKVVLAVVRFVLTGIYAEEHALIARLFTTIIGIFLWFGAGLTLLKIVGMGEIAASLGTATGFIALGISFALSNMIADTVAGVYLLRDPDFTPGDTVTADSVTGVVSAIELRKTRIDLDNGDTVVLANRDVEKKWTRKAESLEQPQPASVDD